MLIYRAITIILVLLVSSCSKEEEPISEIEKNLQTNIKKTNEDYNAADKEQQSIRDDIQNQLISLSCSTLRLIKLKELESGKFKFLITQLINPIKFLTISTDNGILIKNHLAYHYKYKPDLVIHFKDLNAVTFDDNKIYTAANGKITYKNTIDRSEGEYSGKLGILLKQAPQKADNNPEESQNQELYKNRLCPHLYNRSIPYSQEAKATEIRAFALEIAYAIKRIQSFQVRIEKLEQNASLFTVHEGYLNRLLREYQLDKKNSDAIQTAIDGSTTFINATEAAVEQLKQNSQLQLTEEDITEISALFNNSL